MRWRNLLLENLWLKLTALLLASLVWFAVNTHLTGYSAWPLALVPADARREFPSRPVLVLRLPTDHRLFDVEPAAVKVIVGGRLVRLRQLEEGEVNVFVRVPNLADASTEMPLVVQVPKDVNVIRTEPAAVRVKARVVPQ
jgi:YbbR domain-containing protein